MKLKFPTIIANGHCNAKERNLGKKSEENPFRKRRLRVSCIWKPCNNSKLKLNCSYRTPSQKIMDGVTFPTSDIFCIGGINNNNF